MTWEHYSIDNYLNRELRFWKSLKAVYINKGGQNRILKKARKRFADKDIAALAENRFKNMMSLLARFKPKYQKLITERVNKELGSKFRDVFDLNEVQKWQGNDKPGSSLAFGWIEIVVVVVIIVIVIIAELHDNNGVQEDDTVIITVGTSALSELTEDNNYFDCQEISALNYNTWTTYLLMTRAMDSSGSEYVKALICADCANLRTLVQSFSYNHELILPDDITWIGAFLYAAKLEECSIPY